MAKRTGGPDAGNMTITLHCQGAEEWSGDITSLFCLAQADPGSARCPGLPWPANPSSAGGGAKPGWRFPGTSRPRCTMKGRDYSGLASSSAAPGWPAVPVFPCGAPVESPRQVSIRLRGLPAGGPWGHCSMLRQPVRLPPTSTSLWWALPGPALGLSRTPRQPARSCLKHEDLQPQVFSFRDRSATTTGSSSSQGGEARR